jgi:hypothetical protein
MKEIDSLSRPVVLEEGIGELEKTGCSCRGSRRASEDLLFFYREP